MRRRRNRRLQLHLRTAIRRRKYAKRPDCTLMILLQFCVSEADVLSSWQRWTGVFSAVHANFRFVWSSFQLEGTTNRLFRREQYYGKLFYCTVSCSFWGPERIPLAILSPVDDRGWFGALRRRLVFVAYKLAVFGLIIHEESDWENFVQKSISFDETSKESAGGPMTIEHI